MIIQVHPENPQPRKIKEIADCLRGGGVVVYPTDTIYGLGCDIHQPKAVERICKIKNIDPLKAQLSFICKDLSHLSDYTKSIDTPLYRLLKHHLPGPFTFILPASKQVPKLLQTKKSTIGLRVPDHLICMEILEALGNPILSASLPGDNVEDYTDPEHIHEVFGSRVDIVVDSGPGGFMPSTVVDCTSGTFEIIRQGKGNFEA
jgi:tRNA threonylcarbamoyl adenosine modification protein (Sua5/YciO/YrdC/YwlC family)